MGLLQSPFSAVLLFLVFRLWCFFFYVSCLKRGAGNGSFGEEQAETLFSRPINRIQIMDVGTGVMIKCFVCVLLQVESEI